MASVYKNLSEEDLNLEKEISSLPRVEKVFRPELTGLKIAIALTFVLALAALVGAGSLYRSFNQEKRNRQTLEAAQLQIQEKAKSFETTTAQYRAEINRMREQLKNYAGERKNFDRSLQESQTQIVKLQQQLKAVVEKNKAIEQQANKIQEQLAPPLGTAAEEPAEETVDQTAAVSTEEEAAAPAPKTAQILTVNRKFNFVVVNLGIKDQLKIGDSLDVQKQGKNVGSLKVEKLYDNFAAAGIVKEDSKAPLQEGDSIVRR